MNNELIYRLKEERKFAERDHSENGDCLRKVLDDAISALSQPADSGEPVAEDYRRARAEAESLAKWLWQKHYKDDAPNWGLCDSLTGVLSQIDNMICGLSRHLAPLPVQAEPVAFPYPAFIAPGGWLCTASFSAQEVEVRLSSFDDYKRLLNIISGVSATHPAANVSALPDGMVAVQIDDLAELWRWYTLPQFNLTNPDHPLWIGRKQRIESILALATTEPKS